MVQNSKPYIFVSHKLLLALKPLRKIRNSDAVGFAKADRGEFAGVDCPANLLVIGADEFRGLFDCAIDQTFFGLMPMGSSRTHPLE
jgi:hypothetical protein